MSPGGNLTKHVFQVEEKVRWYRLFQSQGGSSNTKGENAQLKKLVPDLSIDGKKLQDVIKNGVRT